MAANARTEYRESVRRSMNLMQAAQAFAQGGNKPPLPPKYALLIFLISRELFLLSQLSHLKKNYMIFPWYLFQFYD